MNYEKIDQDIQRLKVTRLVILIAFSIIFSFSLSSGIYVLYWLEDIAGVFLAGSAGLSLFLIITSYALRKITASLIENIAEEDTTSVARVISLED